MEIKDFNTINLSLEQKKLLKKKIGQGGGSASDDGIPIFYVTEETNTLTFKLMQGKPKVYEWGDLQPIICIDAFSNSYVINAYILPEDFSLTKFNILDFSGISYHCNNDYVNDFLALNVGDSFNINKSELQKEIYYNSLRLASNKDFDTSYYHYSIYINNLETLSVTYNSDGVTLIGRVIKVDQTNHNLYLSIGDEVWKYTYTGGGMTPYSDITFVEVVQS